MKKKIKNKGNRTQIKMNVLKGFRDPLKLKKKCFLKMPSVPGEPFVLIYDDIRYIPPPTTTVPP